MFKNWTGTDRSHCPERGQRGRRRPARQTFRLFSGGAGFVTVCALATDSGMLSLEKQGESR